LIEESNKAQVEQTRLEELKNNYDAYSKYVQQAEAEHQPAWSHSVAGYRLQR
jgi:hypothetical protein